MGVVAINAQHSFNSYMMKNTPLDDICAIAKLVGCDGISLDPAHLENAEVTRLTLRSHGLYPTSVCAIFVDILQQDARFLQDVFNSLNLIGVCSLVVILQGKNVSLSKMAKFCEQLCFAAARYGITILVEPLHPAMNSISCLIGLDGIVSLTNMVEADNFGWVLDICHLTGFSVPSIQREHPRVFDKLRIIHLADIAGIDSDTRAFPNGGATDASRQIRDLIGCGFGGTYELEVLHPELEHMDRSTLIDKCRSALAPCYGPVVIGELAAHSFISEEDLNEPSKQPGGGAGHITMQLLQWGDSVVLAGVCGDDKNGRWLKGYFSGVGHGDMVITQQGAITSEVLRTVDAGCVTSQDICPGTVTIAPLLDVLCRLPDQKLYVFVPFFPNCEELADLVSSKTNWLTIYDFGHYTYVGFPSEIIGAIKRAPQNQYGALINGCGLDLAAKNDIMTLSVNRGFKLVLITDGKNPLLCRYEGDTETYEIDAVEYVRCSHGAGDSFVAGLIHGLCHELPLRQAVIQGIEAANEILRFLGVRGDVLE